MIGYYIKEKYSNWWRNKMKEKEAKLNMQKYPYPTEFLA